MKYKLFMLFLLLWNIIFAQLDSIHYLQPFTSPTIATYVQQEYIYLSTDSRENIDIKITLPDEVTIPRMGVTYGMSTKIEAIIDGHVTINNSTPAKLFFSNTGTTLLAGGKTPIATDRSNSGKVLMADKVGLLLKSNKNFYVNYRARSENQAGSVLAKGQFAKGQFFLWGGLEHEINKTDSNIFASFATMMAKEDNTIVKISGYESGIKFYSGTTEYTPGSEITFTLNKGESYILSVNHQGTSAIQKKGWIGTQIRSSKDIFVTVGSVLIQGSATSNGDIAFDQITPVDLLGNEYILMQGNGSGDRERAMIIATEPNTKLYFNDKISDPNYSFSDSNYILPQPDAILENIGDFINVKGSVGYKNGVMRILSDKNIYVYQKVYGANNHTTPSFIFIPPVSCNGQNEINLIPDANRIGSVRYTSSKLSILARKGDLFKPTVKSNLLDVPLSKGPINVTGNNNWVVYVYDVGTANYGGDLKINSLGTIQVQVFGANGDAGYGGYYSGFSAAPILPITVDYKRFDNVCTGDTGSTLLKPITSNYSGNIQWYKNDVIIPGATSGGYMVPETDTEPAVYKMDLTLSDGCSYYSESIETVKCPCVKPHNINLGQAYSGNVSISTLKLTDTSKLKEVNNSFITLKSNDKGMVMTRISNPETEIKSPELGMIVYDTIVNCFKLYNGKEWKCLRQKCYDYDN